MKKAQKLKRWLRRRNQLASYWDNVIASAQRNGKPKYSYSRFYKCKKIGIKP